MNSPSLIQLIAAGVLPVLLAITVHEAAHGYAARYLGDKTAEMMGRLTLNPLKHIDPLGTIVIPLALYLISNGAFTFGYAKPVPVLARNLRNPRRDMALVALAGPLSNLLMATGWAALLLVFRAAGVTEQFFLLMAQIGLISNIGLMAFNLLPVPPLDGGRIAVSLLPPQPAYWLARAEPYGFFIVMGLVLLNVLDDLWMRPVMSAAYALITVLLTPLKLLLA